MYIKLDASTINQEPIENILLILDSRWDLKLDKRNNSTMISLDWHFSTKYRFDRRKNIVWAFNIEMPNWKPFNFIKSFYFSHLSDNEAKIQTFKWFNNYYWINNDYKEDIKINDRYLKEIKKIAEENRIKQEKLEKSILFRRKTFWIKFSKLSNYYSKWILDYFEWRWISKSTLLKNNARTWIVLHNWKTYKKRVFFPMKVWKDIIWIKMRDLYAKTKEYKSINIPDSWSWLLYNEEDINWKETIYFCEGEVDKLTLDEAWITNSIWNMMWANTFSMKWIEVLKNVKNINILYDFDKDSLAGLKWVYKIMKLIPEKNIRFLDLPKLIASEFNEDRELLLRDFSDINDIWSANLYNWLYKEKFKKIIDENLVSKTINEIEDIIYWFIKINEEEKEKNIWIFSLSYKSKIKSLDDFKISKM